MQSSNERHSRISECYLIVLCLISIFIFKSTVVAGNPGQINFQESLKIIDSKIHFSSSENHNSISCIGTIQNNSGLYWDELVIEVQYFNKENTLIDTITEYYYDLVVPANDKAAFRIKGVADKSASEYIDHKARITTAKVYNKPQKKTKNKALTKMLISWAPLLFLIAIWIIFMKKLSGKNSPQREMMATQKELIELIKEQNSLFKNLVEVIANHTAKIESNDK